jgi:signal transduction histidine kinase
MEQNLVVVWRERGHDGAIQLARVANDRVRQMTIRWIALDADQHAAAVAMPMERLRIADRGKIVATTSRDPFGHASRLMYYPVDVEDQRTGCLEFSAPMESVDHYTRGTVYQTVAFATAVLICGLIVTLFGVRTVGRPLQQLIAQTEKIGKGDFSGRLTLHTHDELSQLAVALNHMSGQLEEQQTKIGAESTARIAAVEQLRHADRLRTVGRLASGVAHELGTPLNVVSGHAELIVSGRLEEPQCRESAEAIKSEADRMADIIRQLLDFARRRSPHRAAIDLHKVAAQSVELLQPMARKRQIALELEDVATPPVTQVDAVQIQQVLTNLVVNAIQAIAGAGTVTISVRETEKTPPEAPESGPVPYYAISVEDDGLGINEEDMAHLFEPFYTTKQTGEGTGLGLSVSYGIVQDHGGWIDAESQSGKGSCFTVYLPVRVEDSP